MLLHDFTPLKQKTFLGEDPDPPPRHHDIAITDLNMLKQSCQMYFWVDKSPVGVIFIRVIVWRAVSMAK